MQDCKKCLYRKFHSGIGFCAKRAEQIGCCGYYIPSQKFIHQRPIHYLREKNEDSRSRNQS